MRSPLRDIGLAGVVAGLLLAVGRCGAAEELTNAPSMSPHTNVIAHRAARDVMEALLEVYPPIPTVVRTNRPARFRGPVIRSQLQPVVTNTVVANPVWDAAAAKALKSGCSLRTNAFAGFVPGSLAGVIWTNFQAHTNGRSTKIWEQGYLPTGWPNTPPVLRWNTNNLMWGRKGMTAVSQVIEGMGSFGQGELTALTRRHGYVRGHSVGPSGLDTTRIGRRIWFCTRNNQIVERKIKLMLIRGPDVPNQGDYSIILFDADLPPGIEPVRVADQLTVRRKYYFGDHSHKPVFMPLQDGYVNAGVEGWTVPFRGGDSGAPLLLPLPGELVFFGGLSTSPPSAPMQADMDMLSRKAGLDPRKYQMQWVKLDAYPDFGP